MLEGVKRFLKVGRYAEEKSADEQKALVLSPALSTAGTTEWDKFFLRPYNPSALWQKKGNYDLIDQMLEDDQVGSILSMKKYVTLATGWDIVGPEEHQPVIDFLKWQFVRYLPFGFTHTLKEILTAYPYGFSMTEKCAHYVGDGPWAGKVAFYALKTRPPHGMLLHTDDYGNLTKIEQDRIELPREKFVHFIHNPEFGGPYGKSDINLGTYRSWFSKNHAVKYGNIFLERYGMPIAVGSFGPRATVADQEQLQKILKGLQAATSVTKPEDFKIELTAAGTGHGAAFQRWIEMHNTMIARSLLVPDLLGMSGPKTGGGSYSLGQEQFGLYYTVLEAEKNQLAMVVNRDLVNRLIEWNFGNPRDIPVQFQFNPVRSEDKEKMARLWLEWVKTGVVEPNEDEVNHFRTQVGYPGGVMVKAPPREPSPTFTGFGQYTMNRAKTEYERKVNFREIEHELDTQEEMAIEELAAIVKRSVGKMVDDIRDRRVIENKNLDFAIDPTLPYEAEFKTAFKGYLRNLYRYGKQTAKREVKGRSEMAIVEDVGGLTGAEVTQLLDDTAEHAANVEWGLLKNGAVPVLQNAISSGLSVKETMKQLDMRLQGYDVAFGAARLETIVRTNFGQVMNQGRIASFEEMTDEIAAYQWSSIIDGRQSEFCERMDGKVFRKDQVSAIKPPAHFNCRSILVPILTGEKFKIDRLPNITTQPGGFLTLAKSGPTSEGV